MRTADITASRKAGPAGGNTFPGRTLFVAKAVALLLVTLAAGCQQPDVCLTSLPDPTYHPQITVYELANRLNLDVRQVGAKGAVLSNAANTVQLPAGAGGWAYVNGKPAVRFGGVSVYAGAVWVPAGLADMLQGRLAPLPRPVPMPQVQPPRSGGVLAGGFRVVIDPGHGGKDPGAISVHGTYEKTINLAVAKNLASQLEARGLRVTLTRETDRFISLDERAAIANRAGADLFVSIHSDSSENRRAKGCTVYVCRDAAAASVQAASAVTGAVSRAGLTSRGVRRADYRVLTRTQCPAVLVELGYLSNPQEARFLAEGSGQQRLAESLADGVVSYLRSGGRR